LRFFVVTLTATRIRMILLWGITTDRPLELVRSALQRMNAPIVFLDQQSLLQSRIDLTVGKRLQGNLQTQGWSAALESVTAVYLRPYDARRMVVLGDAAPGSPKFQRAFGFEDALMSWIEMAPALVVNRPSAMASNNSKPYQLQLVRNAGFDVPETLVTTDPKAAVEFWERHGSVIYKSISGVRSIVTKLGPEHHDRMEDIAHCPTQFQRYIEGTDFRVHIVGAEVFGCEISSAADDYRYPQKLEEQVRVRSCEIPPNVGDRCRELAATMKLSVAGIDLRRTPSGGWYCFEVNPSPGFSFYEEATGQPISEAVAKLLIQGGN
jgi:glutathione synthase/RimK-type ligase-like ATP-grasp enzyme